jgi:PEGA domain
MIESTPAGADVFRVSDGVHLGKTPFTADLQRGIGEAQFLLKLAGYRDATVSLPVDRDGDQTVVLTRGAAPSRSASHGGKSATKTAAKTPAPAPPPAQQPQPPPPPSHSIRNGELHSF